MRSVRFVGADDDAILFTRRHPFAQAGVRPEPRDDRRLRHHREVERAGVAAIMERAVPDDGGNLHEIQIPGKDPPRFLRQQREQLRHFFPLAFRRRAGQDQFLFGKIFPERADELRELPRREFLVIGGCERADVKIGSGISGGNVRSPQIFSRDFDVKFRRCERETGLRQAAAFLKINRLLRARTFDVRGEHPPPERRAAVVGNPSQPFGRAAEKGQPA